MVRLTIADDANRNPHIGYGFRPTAPVEYGEVIPHTQTFD